ncbi:WhiB family transcriptional regulator [Vallicoccus soli]|uniref:Transcriptional regulator WhiB n=1 Tax=Vallicoccus soli TaxID=2339232 RepID=A0A3A3ZKQ3_9ACTN|nr:WhiB family transcriptional regulator [Vallicoccus soli]
MATTRLAPATHIPRYGWQDSAACQGADLDLFFGHEGESRRERAEREQRAAALCGGCPVRDACLRHALVVPERYGVWGGTTEEERRELPTGAALATGALPRVRRPHPHEAA